MLKLVTFAVLLGSALSAQFTSRTEHEVRSAIKQALIQKPKHHHHQQQQHAQHNAARHSGFVDFSKLDAQMSANQHLLDDSTKLVGHAPFPVGYVPKEGTYSIASEHLQMKQHHKSTCNYDFYHNIDKVSVSANTCSHISNMESAQVNGDHQFVIGRIGDLASLNYYSCPQFYTLSMPDQQWTAGINDDFITCMAFNLDATQFPIRLVIGAVGARDPFAPKAVVRPDGSSGLVVHCDSDWTPVEDATTVPSKMLYPRVTHREVCLLTLGYRLKMVTPAQTLTNPNPNEAVYFFTRFAVPQDYVEVAVDIVPGVATGTESTAFATISH